MLNCVKIHCKQKLALKKVVLLYKYNIKLIAKAIYLIQQRSLINWNFYSRGPIYRDMKYSSFIRLHPEYSSLIGGEPDTMRESRERFWVWGVGVILLVNVLRFFFFDSCTWRNNCQFLSNQLIIFEVIIQILLSKCL